MLRRFLSAALLTLFLASCAGPAPASVTPAGSPAPMGIFHAPEIRFALVGQPTDVNVWALFDEAGASYANYALRSDEFPRLYRLSIPAREFEPYTADGMPSIVTREGGFYVATVKLQPGLKWSDGASLNALDAAFTINTALAFHLRLDWLSAYNPALLDHAEAVDDVAVKFFFKGPFNVGDWQYGALQGPIVNRAYWSPKLTEAAALLPAGELIASLEEVKAEAATLQARIDADNAQLLTSLPDTVTYNELSARLTRNQKELNSLNSQVVELQDEYDAALNAARAALFALSDEDEPTFGPFLRATQSGNTFTREVNPAYPFEQPNFDRAAYKIFADESLAMAALENDEVNFILAPNALPIVAVHNMVNNNPALALAYNYTSSARFIVINPSRPIIDDPAFRHALFCAIDRRTLVRALLSHALESFVLPGNGDWLNEDVLSTCTGGPVDRLQIAEILKSAGYTWQKEPTNEEPGDGLISPAGKPFPTITLLAPEENIDPQRAAAARYIEQYARSAGIPLTAKFMNAENIHYAVYSSGDYDMAILGWQLSVYPGYLCDWFHAPGPFEYGNDRLKSACEALSATADLETARQASYEIKSILIEDLPFIPLYHGMTYEPYRHINYPLENAVEFVHVLDGWNGLYGAPSLAIPAP